jgi:hypothetical protein
VKYRFCAARVRTGAAGRELNARLSRRRGGGGQRGGGDRGRGDGDGEWSGARLDSISCFSSDEMELKREGRGMRHTREVLRSSGTSR